MVIVKTCGPDVHTVFKNGSTAVMFAAQNGHADTVLMLVKECGFDVNATNNN